LEGGLFLEQGDAQAGCQNDGDEEWCAGLGHETRGWRTWDFGEIGFR
jgi:hypothetical protein